MLGDHAAPRIPIPRVIAHELEIYGSHGMQAWRYGAMMEMILSGRVAPEKLVGDRITLDDAVPALMSMDGSAATGMAIIDRLD